MIEIRKLSKLYNFKIIEDASHALGAYYNKNPIGNCKYSENHIVQCTIKYFVWNGSTFCRVAESAIEI